MSDDVWTFTTTDLIWDKDYPTGNYTLRSIQPPKHFNCKRCGAINQVDVCEYCGCVAESEVRNDLDIL